MKQDQVMFCAIFFLSTNQSTRSRFILGITKLVEAEKGTEERFSEKVDGEVP